MPAGARHRFSRDGHKVVFFTGGFYYLEDGSKARAKDVKVDWDEGLWRKVGVWPRKRKR